MVYVKNNTGRTRILLAYLQSEDWQQVRERCLKSDEYRCVHCGDKNKRLQVHHRDPRDYQDIQSYEETTALETVCIDCHSEIHGYAPPDKTVESVVLSVLRRYQNEWFTYTEVEERLYRDSSFSRVDVRSFYLDTLPIYAACKRLRKRAREVDSVMITGKWYISYVSRS